MSPPDATRLLLEDHRTTLSDGVGPAVVIAVGVRDIAEGTFRHDPPHPFELEQAIDRVEDALAASGLRQATRGDLLTYDARLCALLDLGANVDRRTRDEVEDRFQRLASVSLGHPAALADLPPGGDAAAALLILRECMHHLGFEGVRRTADVALVP